MRWENAWHSGVVRKQRALKSYALIYSYPSLTHITLHVPCSDMCHHHGRPHMLNLTSHRQQRLLRLSSKNCERTWTRIGKPKSNSLTPYHSYYVQIFSTCTGNYYSAFGFISNFKLDCFSIAPQEIRHISLSAACFQAMGKKRFNFSSKIWVFAIIEFSRKFWIWTIYCS